MAEVRAVAGAVAPLDAASPVALAPPVVDGRAGASGADGGGGGCGKLECVLCCEGGKTSGPADAGGTGDVDEEGVTWTVAPALCGSAPGRCGSLVRKAAATPIPAAVRIPNVISPTTAALRPERDSALDAGDPTGVPRGIVTAMSDVVLPEIASAGSVSGTPEGRSGTGGGAGP